MAGGLGPSPLLGASPPADELASLACQTCPTRTTKLSQYIYDIWNFITYLEDGAQMQIIPQKRCSPVDLIQRAIVDVNDIAWDTFFSWRTCPSHMTKFPQPRVWYLKKYSFSLELCATIKKKTQKGMLPSGSYSKSNLWCECRCIQHINL